MGCTNVPPCEVPCSGCLAGRRRYFINGTLLLSSLPGFHVPPQAKHARDRQQQEQQRAAGAAAPPRPPTPQQQQQQLQQEQLSAQQQQAQQDGGSSAGVSEALRAANKVRYCLELPPTMCSVWLHGGVA